MSIGPSASAPEGGGSVAAQEAGLLERVGAGDRGEPLVALHRRYGSRLYGLGLRLLGDQGMAEELVQDTFVRLWRSSDRFDRRRGSVRTFVFTLARRAAVDLQRRSASRPLPSFAGDAEMVAEDATGPRDAFEDLVVGLDVREALSALSTKHREVLELHYGGDHSQQEISDRLGSRSAPSRPAPTTRSRR